MAAWGMPVPLYASAPNWLRSGQPLLDYLASRRAVQRAVIDRDGLSSLFLNGRVALLLNGWNEIAAADKARAIAGAEDFLADHRDAMVVCTSRRAEGPWTESLDLLAEKLVADGLAAPREQLVALAIRADLTLASKLAGEVQMGAETSAPFAHLIEGIRQLHAATSNSAKKHALACMALTRSPVFASELTALLETADRLDAFALINDAAGLSVRSFGDDITTRFSAWPTEKKHNLLQGLGSQRENLSFLQDVACCDADPDVRARGITTLAWQFPASDAALEAWFASPDVTKLNREVFHSVIDVGNDERVPALIAEVRRLPSTNSEPSMLSAPIIPTCCDG